MSLRLTMLVLTLACASLGCAGRLSSAAGSTASSPTLTGPQLVEIADAFSRSGDSVRAEQYLRRAEKEGVPERIVLPRLLRLYVNDGQYRLAIDLAENHLQRHPTNTQLREFLATLYVAVGHVEDALDEFDAVVAQAPDNAEAHYAIASLLHRAGTEHARASEHYQAYLSLKPNGEHAEEAQAGLLKELP